MNTPAPDAVLRMFRRGQYPQVISAVFPGWTFKHLLATNTVSHEIVICHEETSTWRIIQVVIPLVIPIEKVRARTFIVGEASELDEIIYGLLIKQTTDETFWMVTPNGALTSASVSWFEAGDTGGGSMVTSHIRPVESSKTAWYRPDRLYTMLTPENRARFDFETRLLR